MEKNRGAQRGNNTGMLSPYRVLDLADEKGLLCGKLLGDLGADVIKVEKPGGDAARNLGPFYHDQPDPEKSLFWFAYNTSKRGITLNIETADGKEILRKLVCGADFLIESFPPGYLDTHGLGYNQLEKVNPRLIMVSIAAYGQAGPYRDHKSADITAWATGGQMYTAGSADRAPVRISHHSQSFLLASVDGAVGALTALYQRKLTGRGDHVDVSIQTALAGSLYVNTSVWDMTKVLRQRGELTGGLTVNIRQIWQCKDGYVLWIWTAGQAGVLLNPPLVEYMQQQGSADDFLLRFDWSKHEYETATQDTIDRLEAPTARFFLSRTKAQLMEGALKHGITLYPVATTKDILESPQLASGRFFAAVAHPELGSTVTYPGSFAPSTESPPMISRRAPLIGEHNREIYRNELGLSPEQMEMLKRTGAI